MLEGITNAMAEPLAKAFVKPNDSPINFRVPFPLNSIEIGGVVRIETIKGGVYFLELVHPPEGIVRVAVCKSSKLTPGVIDAVEAGCAIPGTRFVVCVGHRLYIGSIRTSRIRMIGLISSTVMYGILMRIEAAHQSSG